MISEGLMATGSFEIPLKEGTPVSVLEAVQMFGLVCVTPARLPLDAFNSDGVVDSASYTGVAMGWGANRSTLRGFGPASLLGMSGGLSNLFESDFTTSAYTIAQHVRGQVLRNLNGGTGLYHQNGVYEGSLSASATTKSFDISAGTSPLEYLQLIVDAFGVQWRINPDMTLDVDTASTLFGSFNGTAIFVQGGGRDGAGSYWAEIELNEDVEDWTERYIVKPTAGSNGTADIGTNPYYDFYEGAELERERYESNSEANNATDAAAIATNRLATLDDVRREITISIDAYDPRYDLEPGQYVGVYLPDLYVYSLNQYQHRGELVYPSLLRLQTITWPVQFGMGVYVRESDASAEWMDISDHVAWESGPTALTVDNPNRTLNVL